MKILSDYEWMNTLPKIANDARSTGKTIALHTHFNHPREITWVTEVVLPKGMNDELGTMKMLIWKMSCMSDTDI